MCAQEQLIANPGVRQNRFLHSSVSPHHLSLRTLTMRNFPTALLLLLTAIPATAATTPQWFEVRSPHFVVISDINEKEARRLAGQFERMRDLFRKVLPQAGGDASLPITVMALRDRKGFQTLEPASYLAKGSLNLAGLFLRTPDRNYILLRLDTEGPHPYSVVYHEYTHFILRKAEWLPLWLNEGPGGVLPEHRHRRERRPPRPAQRKRHPLPAAEQTHSRSPTLFAVDHNSPYYHEEEKGSVFYAESWALTHFIVINDFDNKTSRLQNYTHLLAQHIDPVSAARQAFGDLTQLQKALDGYVSNGSYKLLTMKSTFTSDDASFQAVPITLSDANAVRADILASNDRRPEARALLDSVLADDPKNALAHETMGSPCAFATTTLPAPKWYGEAVQLDSQSRYMANINFAIFSLMDRDTGNDALIESCLRQAIKLSNPASRPPTTRARGAFLCRAAEEPSMKRTCSSLQAVQIEPEDVHYRINSAMVAMAQQNPDNALNILRAALPIAKTGADIAVVNYEIQRVQRYKDELRKSTQLRKKPAQLRRGGRNAYQQRPFHNLHWPRSPLSRCATHRPPPHRPWSSARRPLLLPYRPDPHRRPPREAGFALLQQLLQDSLQHPQLRPHRRPRPLQGN